MSGADVLGMIRAVLFLAAEIRRLVADPVTAAQLDVEESVRLLDQLDADLSYLRRLRERARAGGG
jgi:arginine decarboxylase-like protein